LNRGIRLLAFDLDGTLLGTDLRLSERVVRAVTRLRERSIEVTVVTGRMRRTAEAYALQLGLAGSPIVFFNGAMAKEVGRSGLWWHKSVAPERAAEIIEFLSGKGLQPLVFSGDRLIAGRPDPEREALYRAIAQVEPEYVGDLLGLVRGPEPLAPTKLLQVEDVSRMPSLYKEAVTRFGASLNVTTSYPFFLEFLDRRARKDRALALVCRRLGIEPREVAAFGDGRNDLDMIRWSGLGVAMSSGPPELLEAADEVIEGPPGDGVARFLEERFLD